MIKIPYSFIPPDVLKKLSYMFFGIATIVEKNFPFLKVNLKQAEMRISAKEYISMCIVSTIFFLYSSKAFLTSSNDKARLLV